MSKENNLSVWYFEGDIVFSNLASPDEQYKMYGLTIAVDDKNYSLFVDSGIQTKVRTDNRTGQKLISFKRPSKKLVNDVMQTVEPPSVIDTNKSVIDANSVARGSSVVAKVLVYKTMKGVGHRLQSVMVTKQMVSPDVHNSTEFSPF